MEGTPIITHEYILTNPPKRKIQITESVAEFILQQIKKFGNTQALVHSLTDEGITYNEIITQTMCIATSLTKKGVRPGDVIGICSENRLEYASTILGILAIGATCAPLNPIYTTNELLHVLSISKPAWIFCSPFTLDKINEIKLKVTFIKELFLYGDPEFNRKFTPFEQFLKMPVDTKTFKTLKLNINESVAFLFCSSGTTGLPKCVELTHANFMNLLNFIMLLWSKEEAGQKRVTLGLIPFFHGYGLCILSLSLLLQILNVVMPRFDEENFLYSIQKYKITNLYVVPPIVVFLGKHPLVSKYDLSSVRKLVCGAAPLSKETQINAQKRLKLNFDIQQGYGMTELSICCVAFQSDVKKVGSSGTIAPGMELKVVDIETGKTQPPYGQGELCFRGPFVMKGYKNNPKATSETFDAEGWFHTGDIGYYDNDGFIYIVSRLKELIKYKGFQVAPAELETILLDHPSVKDAAVIGVPDEEAGELPLAFVVKQPGAKISGEEIKQFVASKVSPQKRLNGGVKFIDEIPKNPSGKILRRVLHGMLKKSKL
ncbi:hypothetical protein RUM43_006967 [Polyplax serrata]|uniref:Luciferin 4-monooxygenase n=1 Tax=Polyplax serrata TaxID=468196 RepID=A0AAN8S574_POLSC